MGEWLEVPSELSMPEVKKSSPEPLYLASAQWKNRLACYGKTPICKANTTGFSEAERQANINFKNPYLVSTWLRKTIFSSSHSATGISHDTEVWEIAGQWLDRDRHSFDTAEVETRATLCSATATQFIHLPGCCGANKTARNAMLRRLSGTFATQILARCSCALWLPQTGITFSPTGVCG